MTVKLYLKVLPHRCELPVASSVDSNAVAHCEECDKWYEIKYDYDQRENAGWYSWRQTEKPKEVAPL